ncbi:MAG: helix-hairpin-helix domain-containing protein [Pyrinomonadaceae bacterium]|nr:helix-hairpin-helix domain-containing protein [Pyrinomonadaceae bacterium]
MKVKLNPSTSRFVIVLFFTTAPLWISSCVIRERIVVETSEITQSDTAIDLNLVSQKQLETLPGIGAEMARRVIEYREQNKGFRRTEELLLIRGISEKKFLVLRSLVKVN